MPLNAEVIPTPAPPDALLSELRALRDLLQQLLVVQAQQAQAAQAVRELLERWAVYGAPTRQA